MTPKLLGLIKTRNSLRKRISTKRKEWIAACTDVAQAKLESKAEQWEEVISAAVNDIDEKGMWKLIKSLNGSPSTNSPNEAMKINGKRSSQPSVKPMRSPSTMLRSVDTS